MDSVIEAKVKDYLVNRLKYRPVDCGAALTQIDNLATAAGFAVDDSFAQAGMGAGPEARIATGIVDLSLGGGGSATSEYEIRKEIDGWLRKYAPVMR